MKLIRWVEVHIGRSRRKSKKEKEGIDGKLTIHAGPDLPRRRDESTPTTPLHKVEPIGKDLQAPRSAGNTPRRTKHPTSPHISLGAPATPTSAAIRRFQQQQQQQQQQHIRTSFLEPSPVPSPGGLSALDAGSPRQRSRIRTNPWLPSPRNSADCGWGRRRATSSVGSESSESVAGSGFGGQSSGSLWDEPWSAFRGGGRSPSATSRLPRVTLERSGGNKPRQTFDEDRPYCPATFCRPIPRSAWMDFREIGTSLAAAADESSDEAYSEDYAEDDEQSDGQEEPLPSSTIAPDTGSPQADSACGSDRDNSSSCSTTPVSETATATRRPSIVETREILRDKVQRLRVERQLVDRRVREAREEEIVRREEQLVLRRELVQFRRLLLLQTLSELRDQLERQEKRRYDSPPSPTAVNTATSTWIHSELV